MKKCPFCAEQIRDEAAVCTHCGRSFNRQISQVALHVVLPVVVGAVIYLIWRVPTLRVFQWTSATGLGDVVATGRAFALHSGIRLPRVFLFTLPDGLWVYSMTAAMALLWLREPPSLAKRCWIGSGFMMALAAELGQAIHVVRGTFDLADVGSYAIAAAVALIATGRTRRSAVI